jgi:hypothetical protein
LLDNVSSLLILRTSFLRLLRHPTLHLLNPAVVFGVLRSHISLALAQRHSLCYLLLLFPSLLLLLFALHLLCPASTICIQVGEDVLLLGLCKIVQAIHKSPRESCAAAAATAAPGSAVAAALSTRRGGAQRGGSGANRSGQMLPSFGELRSVSRRLSLPRILRACLGMW